MSEKRTPLEVLSSVMVLAMCVVVIAVGVRSLLTPSAPDAVRKTPFRAGSDFAKAAPALYEPGRPTLVIGLSTHCRFCTASMPFYKALLKTSAVTSGRLHVGVVSLQPISEMGAYMASHALAINKVVPLVETGLSIAATPALVLVASSGKVVDSWQGQLGPQDEAQVLEAIARIK